MPQQLINPSYFYDANFLPALHRVYSYILQLTCCKQVHAGEEDHAACMDNIKTWTRLPVEEWIRMTEDRDKWRKYVHGVANPRIEDGWRTE